MQTLGPQELPRPLVVDVLRRNLALLRRAGSVPAIDEILARMCSSLESLRRSRLQPVINGTGVLLHTNLGRAPLGTPALHALRDIAAGYTNLELDLKSGERGGRADYVERALAVLSGAQAATIVNNCAAALVLILRHLTSGPRKEVLISRGELVQIGGGFRIPEILEASGAILCEVGTTNRTTLTDYGRAIHRQTALILRVHRSNFFMDGFVASPTIDDLAALARRTRLPFVEDLGSGAVVPTDRLAGVEHEPTPAEVLRQGVDLVCFSGDKLFGGPQAGIIAGKTRLIDALKHDPFFRALRCDKLVLSALQATAEAHLSLSSSSSPALPILTLLRTPLPELRTRARRLSENLADLPLRASPGTGHGQVGGGTLPRVALESVTLDLQHPHLSPNELLARLRQTAPPVIGYVRSGCVKIDLRTVFADQDSLLLQAIRRSLRSQ